MKFKVRSSTGDIFDVEAEAANSIAELKEIVKKQIDIPADQQRLIYKGRVMKDELTIEFYGIEEGKTVHLVRGVIPTQKPASTTAAASAGTVAQSTSAPGTATPAVGAAANANNPFAALGGLGGFGGLGGAGGMNPGSIMQNPEMMANIMNSPMMQSMLDNPEIMRSVMMSNPQIRAMMDANPHLASILEDPQLMRQSMEAASNPAMMQEMMRNTDRAMMNIESIPGGFNAMRQMYHDIQEPMQNAASSAFQGDSSSSSNLANVSQQQQQEQKTSETPNTRPMPNPWGRQPTTTPAATSTTPNANVGMPGLGGLNFANLFGQQMNANSNAAAAANPWANLGAPASTASGANSATPAASVNPMLGGIDPNMMSSMMQNPFIQQQVQQMLSNPDVIRQMEQTNPMLQQLFQTNPEMRNILSNPDFLAQMTNPQMMQNMMNMGGDARSMMSMMPPSLNPGIGASTGGATAAGLNPLPAVSTNTLPPEERYAVQLQQLETMGFDNREVNIAALTACNGNVNRAVERLLQ